MPPTRTYVNCLAASLPWCKVETFSGVSGEFRTPTCRLCTFSDRYTCAVRPPTRLSP